MESVIHLLKIRCSKSTGFFFNVTSSQKKTLSCGMIKPHSINKKEVANMKIKLNSDQEIVNMKRNMVFRRMESEADPGWGGL